MNKDEKTCYNCGNKNCNIYYSMVKKDYKRHFETYEYKDFDCVNHNKWEELKMEEIHTDNTNTLQNALDRIEELEKANKWHYPSKGEYPKDEKDLLMSNQLNLLIKMKGSDCLSLALGQYNFSTQQFVYQHLVGLTEVYAWKEIVLPELKEGCLHEIKDKKKNDF